jgi:threonine dehydratase
MINFESIENASRVISPLIIRTPCVRSGELSKIFNRPVYLKLENLQVTGAFKIRGNAYKLTKMSDEELQAGVVTASSGNHGLGLSLSALRRSVKAKIVVPVRTPENKIEKIKQFGADVLIEGESYRESVVKAKKIASQEGSVYVSSFDDIDIITGNATMGIEIFEDVPDISLMIAPVGGGGGISGISLALRKLSPSVRIIGVQAAGAASMGLSFSEGCRVELESVNTVADGIAVAAPGEITFPIVREFVEKIVTVQEDSILAAVGLLAYRAKIVAEPAGAASLAALSTIEDFPAEGSVVCLVSGGNIDKKVLAGAIVR